jgi:GDPmannose 4,6-dehydratase
MWIAEPLHERTDRIQSQPPLRQAQRGQAIKLGLQKKLYLGNIDSSRDWGHARDYVEGMWLMMQQDEADDYVLATGETTRVRTFVEWAFADAGFELTWTGEGVDEKGYCAKTGRCLVEVDPRYFRPTEVELLLGNPAKAKEKLGWTPDVSFEQLVIMMVDADLDRQMGKTVTA